MTQIWCNMQKFNKLSQPNWLESAKNEFEKNFPNNMKCTFCNLTIVYPQTYCPGCTNSKSKIFCMEIYD